MNTRKELSRQSLFHNAVLLLTVKCLKFVDQTELARLST